MVGDRVKTKVTNRKRCDTMKISRKEKAPHNAGLLNIEYR
jgi:hypothetical protein